MNRLFRNLLLITALFGWGMSGCTQPKSKVENTSNKLFMGYDMSDPTTKHQLPYDLEEISGLTYYQDSIVAAVQDESGKVFFYNYVIGGLVDQFKFAGSGDYEGIEYAQGKMYVTKSNGTIYQITPKSRKGKEYKTDLSQKNDVEGLGYNSQKGELILACKADPKVGKNDPKGRAFYAFDLEDHELSKKHEFNITKGDIEDYFKSIDKEVKVKEFKPSGIAYHPITGDIYVLAHGGKWLIVLSDRKDIKAVTKLSGKLFRQSEGICFAPSGDMLISNEGKGDRGNILVFTYKQNQ